MAASFAEYMARMSASMIHAALANAAEKAAAAHHQQQQQQSRANGTQSLPFFPLPLLTLPSSTQQTLQNGTVNDTNRTDSSKTLTDHSGSTTAATSAKVKASRSNDKGTFTAANASNEQSNGTEQQQLQQKPQNDGLKKRKRPCPPTPAAEEPQKQQLIVPAERQPSDSPLSSRISSPDSVHRTANGRGARKLKLYVAEEKVDIIDYAKCIGNRAAGREFNVAESSIREWRKNEEKIRRQAETTSGCTQHFELAQPTILAWIDDELVKMVDEKCEECADWYGIATKAQKLWADRVENSEQLDGSEMKVTMGWVSRFMRRNEHRVPKIAPPIIATGNVPSSGSSCSASGSANNARGAGVGLSSGVSMVKSNPLPASTSHSKQQETRSKARPKTTEERSRQKRAKASNGTVKANVADALGDQASSPEAFVPTSSRRRKCPRPMRVDAACATLLTTSSPTDVGHVGGVA